jgi:hypothetical protein
MSGKKASERDVPLTKANRRGAEQNNMPVVCCVWKDGTEHELLAGATGQAPLMNWSQCCDQSIVL